MHNWQENEIKELLSIRGSVPIRNQMTGTVKDSVVYQRITKLLGERGVHRSHMQVISKLKALRKQYLKHHQQKTRQGIERVDWPFYEQCHAVFGEAPAGILVKRQRSPTPPPPPSPPSPPPPPPACSEEAEEEAAAAAHEVVVGLWDEVDSGEIDKHLGAAEDEQQYNSPDHLPPIAYAVPPRKKKTTVMQQVSTLVSATVSQLREMDAAMQAQEDARLQRLMDHEKEMQSNLMGQLVAMQERIVQQNHQRQLELVDRLLSGFPAPSGPSGPSGQ